MTDPMGSVFVSYRRSPARPAGDDEAALVTDALRRTGIPTWRDLDSLAHQPTEEALIAALKDSSLSGAILLVTPEVASSTIVKNIEAVQIFRRYKARDGFWVLPVLINLDYDEADSVLGSPAGFQDVGQWNMYKIKGDTVRTSHARSIARRALKARLHTIGENNASSCLSIGVFARRPPSTATYTLCHDFSARFHGRHVDDGEYKTFETNLLDGASRILQAFQSPRLVGEGVAPLPLGALVGAVYTPRAGFELSWSQFVEGRSPQLWSFDLTKDSIEIETQTTFGDPSSEDLVLAVGFSADIEHAVSESLSHLGIAHRACLHCTPCSGSYTPGKVIDPVQGVGFVLAAIQEIRDLREDLAMKRANLHLFLACPLAMAVLLGQKLNTFAHCHMYEHDSKANPSYLHVHTFQPSSLVYK